jgi:hypothetical protein
LAQIVRGDRRQRLVSLLALAHRWREHPRPPVRVTARNPTTVLQCAAHLRATHSACPRMWPRSGSDPAGSNGLNELSTREASTTAQRVVHPRHSGAWHGHDAAYSSKAATSAPRVETPTPTTTFVCETHCRTTNGLILNTANTIKRITAGQDGILQSLANSKRTSLRLGQFIANGF